MQKTILITGSTDGIGHRTARQLVERGHRVLLHGRNPTKLSGVMNELAGLARDGHIESFHADFSVIHEVEALARAVADRHERLDVLINNAGVFATKDRLTRAGLDVRFVVNTIAPYLLTKELLPLLDATGRVINLSSAAQSAVDLDAFTGDVELATGTAYAQSKLALTMWSRSLATSLGASGPAVIAVNPGSMLGTKMVQEAYGVAGADVRKGADVLCRAALDEEFAMASGQYFDNDAGRLAPPHPDALDDRKCEQIVRAIERALARVRCR